MCARSISRLVRPRCRSEVIEQARDELLDWRRSGMSVMEVSHRSASFMQMAAEAESDLRELLDVPVNYKILFMQGGASAQFSIVPMNLAPADAAADYINTGHWSQKAIKEAARYLRVHVAADAGSPYTRVPPQSQLRFGERPAYVHYTPNETIGGVEFGYVPDTRGVPLVADMSSTILSRPIDVSRFGLIYAGAQKNIGPAGMVVVIVREDLIGKARPGTPTVFDYRAVAAEGSMLNTPPTFAWYVAGLVFKWLKRGGGLAAAAQHNSDEGRAALRGNRWFGAVPECGRRGRTLVDECDVQIEPTGAGNRILAGSGGGGLEELEGTSGGRRHAREHI